MCGASAAAAGGPSQARLPDTEGGRATRAVGARFDRRRSESDARSGVPSGAARRLSMHIGTEKRPLNLHVFGCTSQHS